MREAHLYHKTEDDTVQCFNCAHRCTIPAGKRGVCGVRENRDGTLYTLVYGRPCALHTDPIEKKPLYHFLPGTHSLSLATPGCQFACKNCQNWQISQGPKHGEPVEGIAVSPEEVVAEAKRQNVPSISYTYTDPNIYSEYALDIMYRAYDASIRNVWVSSGYWTPELSERVLPYLHAANIDLKAFDDATYLENYGGKLQPVLDTLRRIKDADVWLEVTTLVIPGVNDDEETLSAIARFIADELGPRTPWHVSRFSGEISWKLQHVPATPIETLMRAAQIGREAGLSYVYCGNVPDADSTTYCPTCDSVCVTRSGMRVQRYDVNGHCPSCSESLPLIL